MGGNLLLDIGPKPDGTIPGEQMEVLTELGRWTSKHSQAVFGSVAGLPPGCFDGPSTMSPDSTTVYLFLNGDGGGEIMLQGVMNRINKAVVIERHQPGDQGYLRLVSNHAGIFYQGA
jgi:alpha-L-fucosidase